MCGRAGGDWSAGWQRCDGSGAERGVMLCVRITRVGSKITRGADSAQCPAAGCPCGCPQGPQPNRSRQCARQTALPSCKESNAYSTVLYKVAPKGYATCTDNSLLYRYRAVATKGTPSRVQYTLLPFGTVLPNSITENPPPRLFAPSLPSLTFPPPPQNCPLPLPTPPNPFPSPASPSLSTFFSTYRPSSRTSISPSPSQLPNCPPVPHSPFSLPRPRHAPPPSRPPLPPPSSPPPPLNPGHPSPRPAAPLRLPTLRPTTTRASRPHHRPRPVRRTGGSLSPTHRFHSRRRRVRPASRSIRSHRPGPIRAHPRRPLPARLHRSHALPARK